MNFDALFDLGSGPGRWAITIVGFILFLFLVARRAGMRKVAKGKSPFVQEDIIVAWDKGPGGQITVAPWMEATEVKAVFAALTRDGKEARFIGGCVRDAVLHRDVHDIDLATQERPEKVMELLADAGIKAIPTGIEHGTVTAVINKTAFQITTLRKDIKTDGRHAVVEFTEDWRIDAERRDFTFNSLSADQDGMIYDYLNGLQDLANRVITFVGRADERINEDRLRILRFFRFIAAYGMRIGDRREFEVCVNNAKYLTELSRERIRAELFKIIGSQNHFDALRLMYDHGVLEPILPEAKVSEVFRRLTWLETSAVKFDAVKPDIIRRLASLVEIDADGFDALATRLVLSNAEKTHLRQLVTPAWAATPDIGDDDLRALLYRMEASIVIDLVLLEWARRLIMTPKLPRGESDNWQKIIAAVEASEKLNFPLRGRDVLELGVEKGPRVSKMLSEVERWWTKGGCHGSRDQCLEKLEMLVDQ